MSGFWETLGLEPTEDAAAIRRAYAERAKACHPEEDQEGFLKLRQAYQAALAWAERAGGSAASGQGNSGSDNRDAGPRAPAGGPLQEPAEESEPDGEPEDWQFPAVEELPNPYCDSEAIRKFEELFSGEQRKNAKQWMEYFTSDAFLDAG